MKTLPMQASFTSGELSPSLRARCDLARYMTGAARLENFIALPQGGITRRPGFVNIKNYSVPVYLVPFKYNADDSMILIFNGTNVITAIGGGGIERSFTISVEAPVYNVSTLSTLRCVQRGNMMFFAHPEYPPCLLRRGANMSWSFEPFEFKEGPWLADSGKNRPEAYLRVRSQENGEWLFRGSAEEFGPAELSRGDVIRADVIVGGGLDGEVPGRGTFDVSASIVVKGAWEFSTSGKNWGGSVHIEKSYDNGISWYVVKTYDKRREEDGNNVMFSGAEDDDDVLYRVRAYTLPNDSATLYYNFVTPPFVKSLSFRVTVAPVVNGGESAFRGRLLTDTNFVCYDIDAPASDWGKCAWDAKNGYPSAVTFYQERLVFAGTESEPQTVWMSKIGDYANFAVSDPLRDDDSITLVLAGDENDKIHSLVSMTDLLAFTRAGEWRISGSGDGGAIAPAAVTAHQQTRMGSKAIQPVVVGNSVVFVQESGAKVHAISYNLQSDGYAGSELSILSDHIFARREITGMAFQQTPDSIIWFAQEDGTMAACTFNPEHDVVAWGRHIVSNRLVKQVCALPSMSKWHGVDVYAVIFSGGTYSVERMGSRILNDAPPSDRSVLETLSVNMGEGGDSMLPRKKLVSRVFIYTIDSERMRVSPSGPGFPDDGSRVRTSNIDMGETEIMLDSGFGRGAAVRIEPVGTGALTILAVVPVFGVNDY